MIREFSLTPCSYITDFIDMYSVRHTSFFIHQFMFIMYIYTLAIISHLAVGFSLNGQYYPNGSAISLSSIGQDDSALRCLTNGTCCIPPNRAGEFYYPDGSKVNTQATGEDFYRNRGEMMIRLHRRNGAASPTGLYKCVIPDSSGELMTLHITLNRLTSQ